MSASLRGGEQETLQTWRLPWPRVNQPHRLPHWTIHGAYASPIACALHLTATQAPGPSRVIGDPDPDAREELHRVMNMVRMRAYDLGHVMPIIAFVVVKTAHVKELQAWAADSEWTGGRFIMIVASSDQTAARDDTLPLKLLELLDPSLALFDLDRLHLELPFVEFIKDGISKAPGDSLMRWLERHAGDVDRDPGALTAIINRWQSDRTARSRELLEHFRTEP